ncbi:MAG: HEAT repeat domain-containing protein, partial [Pirellulaceae bacterium]|nr:HEAT repeat domain-containing protein [Pirellulaceae bacterium]
VPELRNRLTSNDAEVRAQAADVLGRIGPDANEAIPELIILLDDESGPVRRSAARALGQIGPAAEQAVPSLMRVLEDETLKKQTRDDNDAE